MATKGRSLTLLIRPVVRSLLLLAVWLPLLLQAQTRIEPSPAHIALRGLGISAAISQLDNLIAQTVSRMAADSTPPWSEARQQQLQQQLQAVTGTAVIQPAVERQVASKLSAPASKGITLLQDELVMRVRNFDVSLEMRGAVDKFQRFQQQLQLDDILRQRLELLERMDTALQMSKTAARLQTELEQSAIRLASDPEHAVPTALEGLSAQKQHFRQQHLAKVLVQLNLYSYRYLQDEELRQYVEILEQEPVQALLAVCQQALWQSLSAAISQPPHLPAQ